MTDAYVALEDGRVIEARSRAPGRTRGELVFTTAYTGYEESLTDPSYEEQILTFSYSPDRVTTGSERSDSSPIESTHEASSPGS